MSMTRFYRFYTDVAPLGLYSKARKYVYTLKSNNSANTLARWRGFAVYTPKCDLHS